MTKKKAERLTPSQQRALGILVDHGRPMGGSEFGYAMWPDDRRSKRRALRSQGAGFAGGGYLAKLRKLGLVELVVNSDRYCHVYRPTSLGLGLMRRIDWRRA